MECPWPSVMPEAVRNSVSMRSEITGARAGIRAFNSASLALCHAPDSLWGLARSTDCMRLSLKKTALAPPHDATYRNSGEAAAYAAVAVSKTNHTAKDDLGWLVKMDDPPLQRGGRCLGAIGEDRK